MEWWQDKVMGQSGETTNMVSDFLQKARQAKPGCNGGLVCLPYFGGERAPVWDANARGMLMVFITAMDNRSLRGLFLRAFSFLSGY